MGVIIENDNFLELDTVEQANTVKFSEYVFLDKLSASKGKYCFKRRQR